VTAHLRLVAYTARYLGDDLGRDLEDIRRRAERNNRRDDLTGALVVDQGRFVQAIEGPPGAVERALERIAADPRCGPLEHLFDVEVPRRSMGEWSMWIGRVDGARGLADDELRRLRDAYLRGFQPDAMGFLMILRSLIDAHPAASPGGSP
jgi:hypothetical protein